MCCGHFETNPKILKPLEGLEGYLCPGVHILGIVCIFGMPFYTSGSGPLTSSKSNLENFCSQSELHTLSKTVLRVHILAMFVYNCFCSIFFILVRILAFAITRGIVIIVSK